MTVRCKAAALPLVAVGLAALVSGCAGDDEAPLAGPASTGPLTTAATTTTLTPSPTPTTTTSRRPTPTLTFSRVPTPTRPVVVPSAAGSTVVLAASGLAFVTGDRTQTVSFGSAASTVTTALTSSLGKGATRDLATCGQGPRTQVDFDGFTVLLASSRFVGWTENGSAERDLMTADGLALQVSLATVRQALPDAKVRTGSLGPEFTSATGVSGLLDGTQQQSRVTLLYSGETCFSR